MTEEQKQKIIEKSFNNIMDILNLHGKGDIFLTDSKFRDMIVAVYQQGGKDFLEFGIVKDKEK